MGELRHAELSRPLLTGFDSVPPDGLAPGAVVRQLRELHSAFTAQSETPWPLPLAALKDENRCGVG